MNYLMNCLRKYLVVHVSLLFASGAYAHAGVGQQAFALHQMLHAAPVLMGVLVLAGSLVLGLAYRKVILQAKRQAPTSR